MIQKISKEEYDTEHHEIIKTLNKIRINFFGSLKNYFSFFEPYKKFEERKKEIQRNFSKKYLYYYNVGLAKIFQHYDNEIYYVPSSDFRGRKYPVTNTFSATSGILKNFTIVIRNTVANHSKGFLL